MPVLVVIPLAAALIIPLTGRIWRRSGDLLGSLATGVLVVLSLLLTYYVSRVGFLKYYLGGWAIREGITIGIGMVADSLTVLMLLVVNSVSFLVSIYSISYMEKYTAKPLYYTLLMLMVAGMNGIILTGDLFNLFVFFEIAVISSYALVAFGTEEEELEASFKYQVLSSLGSLSILLGIVIILGRTGALNMADISTLLATQPRAFSLNFVAALFLFGFGLKASLVPFHAWLPDAHPAAPSPVSAMLSGVFIKVAGVYALTRIFFNVLGMTATLSSLLLILGIISMVVGALLALGQEDIKRLLAYSSISQIGYVMIGLGTGTPLGILGGLFHLFNHATFKSLLFLCAGSAEYTTGTRELKKLGGLTERMPISGYTSAIGSLAIAGVPPFNGFWSKLFIVIALVQSGKWAVAVITILISVLTLGYFLKVQRLAFFGRIPERWKNIREVPGGMCFALIVLAIICLLVGITFPWFLRNLFNPAVQVLLQGTGYAQLILGSGG